MMDLEILVVDDDPISRKIVSRCLNEAKYQVTTACSGEEAVKLMSEKVYDVVITDLVMPGEIDGIGVLEYAKKQSDHIEVILMTAHGTVKTAVEAMKKGAADYFLKPIDLAEVLFRVQKVASFRCLLKNTEDLRMAMETTERVTSETIQDLEFTVAKFCDACCRMKRILDNPEMEKESRIDQAREILNELAKEYLGTSGSHP